MLGRSETMSAKLEISYWLVDSLARLTSCASSSRNSSCRVLSPEQNMHNHFKMLTENMILRLMAERHFALEQHVFLCFRKLAAAMWHTIFAFEDLGASVRTSRNP